MISPGKSDSEVQARLQDTRIVAVLIIDDAADAVSVARALLDGGVDCMELTLRTDAAIDSIHQICRDVPEMLVGAGTVLTPRQVSEVKAAGAAFGVAPGMNPRVVNEAQKIGLPFAPGVCTPTDIELALERDCRLLKFFPCGPCGGLEYLRSIAAPFSHLGVKFIPLGGVNEANVEAYLREPLVLAVGGSWLAPREQIRRRDWDGITRNARVVTSAVQHLNGAER